LGTRFLSRSVIVTGAASGLGAECARQFSAEGAHLTLVDLDFDRLLAVSKKYDLDNSKVELIAGNVADERVAETAVRSAISRFGGVDILINNAAIDPLEARGVAETSIELWDRIINVNLRGAYLFARQVIPIMASVGRGSLVHTASISALKPTPTEAAYSVSKAALLQLSRSIALDYAPSGIRSNCICPGFLESVMSDRADTMTLEQLASRAGSAADIVPLGREGRYSEIATSILFLSSDDSSYITGSTFVIDGGMSLV
jgi:NAD(P)-dependent dehydrogenase (short-subunit alcohol dehydrogenase family)